MYPFPADLPVLFWVIDVSKYRKHHIASKLAPPPFAAPSPIFFVGCHQQNQVQKEEEQVGSVAGDVYATYIQAAGGWCLALTVVLGVLCGQGFFGAKKLETPNEKHKLRC